MAEISVGAELVVIVITNVVIESQLLILPKDIVSLKVFEVYSQEPKMKAESHSFTITVAKLGGNRVVVTVCTESHKNWLGFVTLATPVFNGSQVVAAANVESELLIVKFKVTNESQPVAAPFGILNVVVVLDV